MLPRAWLRDVREQNKIDIGFFRETSRILGVRSPAVREGMFFHRALLSRSGF